MTEFNHSVGGSITPSGTHGSETQQNLGGSLTVSGTVSKLLSVSFAGALSLVGVVIKKAQSILGGTITPAGVSGEATVSGSGRVEEIVRINAHLNRTIRLDVSREIE